MKLVTAIIMLLSASISMAQLKIVVDGKPQCVIESPKNATATETFAAEELSRYVKQMSGAALPHETGGDGDGNRIIVGNYDHVASLREMVAFPAANDPDGYTIVSTPNAVCIAGATDGATLHAVYVFLDHLGCRFLAPQFEQYDGNAEVIPHSTSLTAEGPYDTFKPAFKFRKLCIGEGHSFTPENLAQIVDWMPKVGYNTLVVPLDYQGRGNVMWSSFRPLVMPACEKRGITIEVGGHGYQNFLNAHMEDGKLFELHPEWFGADKTGARHPQPGHVFCTSNSQAVDFVTKNFIAYIKDHSEIQIFDFWPPDGATWCQCDQCEKIGSAADREAVLVNHMQDAIEKIRPGLRMEFIAYQLAIAPPEHTTVDPRIIVDFCPSHQEYDHQINDPTSEKNKMYADALLAWRKAFKGDIGIFSYYRKYIWDSLPVILPHYLQKDLQWYASVPVQGISTYCEPADWFTYELNDYVMAALEWNPDANVDALIAQFCDARYGDDAALARHTFMILEKVVRRDCAVLDVSLKSAEEIAAAQSEVRKAIDELSTAASLAKDKSLKWSLERLGYMCTYAARDLEIQHLRATGASNEQIIAKAKTLEQYLKDHADDGVFLVKDRRGTLPRLLVRYGISKKPIKAHNGE
ncbi:MAG TPA: DUF4838 domain-containing protein [Tepidisphaeraceae bacterium]|nr:DUF4838 domain-containing protein [Tepidisphaeraceae bacterium]